MEFNQDRLNRLIQHLMYEPSQTTNQRPSQTNSTSSTHSSDNVVDDDSNNETKQFLIVIFKDRNISSMLQARSLARQERVSL